MYYYFATIGVIGAILCAALGLFTLLRNPRHLTNIGFALGMSSLAVIEAGCTLILLSPLREGFAEAGARILLSGQAALPAAWLLFSIVFARANYREILIRWTPVLLICSALSIFFIFSAGSLFLVRVEGGGILATDLPYLSLNPLGRYFNIYLIVGSAINLVHLETTIRSSSASKRWHIKYFILGVGSILTYFIYLSSQSLLFSLQGFESVLLTATVILISTSMMAVFIVKHRLLDVDIFISRYVIYNSLTVLVIGFYLLSVGIIAQGIRYFKVPFGFFFTTLFIFTSILLLMVFFFMASLRRKVQLFINKHFYKHKYEFRDKWMETIEKISGKRSVPEIRSTLREMIGETTGAKPVYLWLYDPVTRSYQAGNEVPEAFRRVALGSSFPGLLSKPLGPFTVEDVSVGNGPCAALLAQMFAGTGAVLCTPLVADQEVTGFIMQGPDQSNEPYIQDDFEILTAMSTQAAVQIRNITMAQELADAREVDTFSRISTFIMHDLKNLTNSLSLISQNAEQNMDNPEFRKDTIRTIDGTVSRMKRLIDRLSNVPRGVELKMVETDVGEFIRSTLKKIHLPHDKEVVITSDVDPVPPIYIDHEAVEMVLVNLIANAYDAIDKEGIIKVYANSNGESVNMVVQDNGSGISSEWIGAALFRPFKTTKKNGFGIGLYQCKTLIEAHGGTISVQSEVGRGTSFTVTLPSGSMTGPPGGIKASEL
ncbi:MAG: XrtA/PEP-CTERM system histidine kinase PrsK [Thermodesulfobacteriota bacterium]